MNDNVIISFKNVCKEYILYKSDKARFKALFIKPKNPKIQHLTMFPLKLKRVNPLVFLAITVPEKVHFLR